MDSVSAIALSISSRLISRGKEKALMNMTSGIDMLALALTISREVWIFLISSVILIYTLLSRTMESSLITRPISRSVWFSMYLLTFFCNLKTKFHSVWGVKAYEICRSNFLQQRCQVCIQASGISWRLHFPFHLSLFCPLIPGDDASSRASTCVECVIHGSHIVCF